MPPQFDLAAAIPALEWDVGYKVRALLPTNGTLEINCRERRQPDTGGTIAQDDDWTRTGHVPTRWTVVPFCLVGADQFDYAKAS